MTRRNLWLTKRARPAEAPRETRRGLVEVAVGGVVRSVYVIGWDSPQGPVLYFVPLDGVPAAEWDLLVWQLCEQLLEREQWNRAVLIDPVPIALTSGDGDGPRVRLHRVKFSPGCEGGGPRLKRGDDHPVAQVAWALQAVLPVWIAGTETVATARAALANPGRTLTVADPTAWPGREASLRVALQARFPQLYPLGWAILAAEGNALLHEIVAAHARTPDRGEGWHLVARPQVPQPPERLRPLLAEAVVPAELGEPAVAEIAALRAAAITGDPRGVLYRSVAERLASLTVQVQMAQLARNAPQPSFLSPWVGETVTTTATWAGPAVETWRRTLIPVADLPTVVRLERVADLLRFTRPGEVREAYLDWAGRLVLVLSDPDGPDPTPWMCAEWPCDERVTANWTDDTILAADRPVPSAPAGPLLALTPGDGEVRVDQFPLSSRLGGPPRLAVGDATRDGRNLFRVVLRLALEPAAAAQADRNFFFETIVEDPGMTLWPAVMGAGASLRLRWDTARALAAADFARALRLLAPDAPKIYRYYAIALREDAPLEETTQVVRTSAGPGGFATEEHLKHTGGWMRSFILDDIGRCKGNDEYRRIRPDEVGKYIAVVYPQWADI